MRTGLLLLTVTILLMLGGLELATRWLFADVTTTADNASYFTERWRAAHEGDINRYGFREREIDGKVPGVLRLAVVGDSYTYGPGLARDERLTERLDRALGPSVEVLNFGIPGADYPEHATNMALALEVADPDFVILQWLFNDVREPGHDGGRLRSQPLIGALNRWLQPHSALYFMARQAFRTMRDRLGLLPPPNAPYRPYLEPEGAPARAARARLERVLDIAAEADVPHAMILWARGADVADVPHTGGDGGSVSLDPLFEQVLAVCAARAIPCLDLRPALRRAPPDRSLAVNRFDPHPSAFANQLAAEAVVPWLEPLLQQR